MVHVFVMLTIFFTAVISFWVYIIKKEKRPFGDVFRMAGFSAAALMFVMYLLIQSAKPF